MCKRGLAGVAYRLGTVGNIWSCLHLHGGKTCLSSRCLCNYETEADVINNGMELSNEEGAGEEDKDRDFELYLAEWVKEEGVEHCKHIAIIDSLLYMKQQKEMSHFRY